jgi:hypothetical protein
MATARMDGPRDDAILLLLRDSGFIDIKPGDRKEKTQIITIRYANGEILNMQKLFPALEGLGYKKGIVVDEHGWNVIKFEK